MNLPEYRAAIRVAQMRFEDAVREASAVLSKDVVAADELFFSEQDIPMERDDERAAMKRVHG